MFTFSSRNFLVNFKTTTLALINEVSNYPPTPLIGVDAFGKILLLDNFSTMLSVT
jgi:hypothetical protein